MFKLKIILGILVVIVLIGYLVSLLPGWNTFQKEGIKIKYPKKWEMTEGYSGSLVAFAAPAETAMDIFRENVVIDVQEPPPDIKNLDQFAKLATNQLKAVFNNVAVVESGPLTIGRLSAQKIVYTAQSEVSLKAMHVWFMNEYGKKVYTITYMAEAAKFDQYLKDVQIMINSFDFEG